MVVKLGKRNFQFRSGPVDVMTIIRRTGDGEREGTTASDCPSEYKYTASNNQSAPPPSNRQHARASVLPPGPLALLRLLCGWMDDRWSHCSTIANSRGGAKSPRQNAHSSQQLLSAVVCLSIRIHA